MGTAYNINAKTAPCPRCGTGVIYTQAEMRSNNPTLGGIQVCVKCKSNDLIDQALNRRAQ